MKHIGKIIFLGMCALAIYGGLSIFGGNKSADEIPAYGQVQPIKVEPKNPAEELKRVKGSKKTSSDKSETTSATSATKSGNERLIELPAKLKGTPERIISRMAYTLSFNRETNQPNWVAWCLEDSETEGTVSRSDEFFVDPDIPSPHQVESYDYKGSGYDRGHMAPAADMKFSAQAMRECFYLSNICPQMHQLNSGAWSKLEGACRRWAKKFGKVYIVCGPIFYDGKHKSIGKDHKIPVPDAFFKCVYAENNGNPQAIGFIMRNTGAKQSMNNSALTVDEVEESTGMNFFPNLPSKVEKKVESQYSMKDWQ